MNFYYLVVNIVMVKILRYTMIYIDGILKRMNGNILNLLILLHLVVHNPNQHVTFQLRHQYKASGGIAKGCELSGCALIGGETAEMPGMYPPGEYDLAGFAVGAVEKSKIITGNTIVPGDVVLAIGSSGAHSNGYSLVRKIIERAGAKPSDDLGGRPLGDVVMEPTEIYVKPLLKLISELDVKGMAHITGGGLVDNVPRVLPENTQAVLHRDSWQMPELFRWLQMKGGVADAEMVRVFNCGIGMVVIVAPEQVDAAIQSLTTQGLKAWVVGEVIERPKNAPQTIVI
jgi:phosphoribosylformylglycinamidine cyclo-ligase